MRSPSKNLRPERQETVVIEGLNDDHLPDHSCALTTILTAKCGGDPEGWLRKRVVAFRMLPVILLLVSSVSVVAGEKLAGGRNDAVDPVVLGSVHPVSDGHLEALWGLFKEEPDLGTRYILAVKMATYETHRSYEIMEQLRGSSEPEIKGIAIDAMNRRGYGGN